jgi:DinB superfamily
METPEILADAFGRVRELYVGIAGDLDAESGHRRPGGTGNPIAWLLWHTARVQDDHVAGLSGTEQAWHAGWAERFGLPFDEDDIGYGHSSDEVDAVRIDRFEDLVAYHEEVHRLSLEYVGRVDADELDRVVDRRWDPPVTAGVRTVSLLADCLQHLGQAAYVKGLPSLEE